VLIGSAYSIFRNGKNSFRGVRPEEASLVYWGNKNIRDGVCDMVAIGRQSLADPLLPAKLQSAKATTSTVYGLRQLHRVSHPSATGRLLHLRSPIRQLAAGDPQA